MHVITTLLHMIKNLLKCMGFVRDRGLLVSEIFIFFDLASFRRPLSSTQVQLDWGKGLEDVRSRFCLPEHPDETKVQLINLHHWHRWMTLEHHH